MPLAVVRARPTDTPAVLIHVDTETNFSGVLSLMKQHRVHRVLVTDNLIALCGIISVSDIALLLI